MAIDGPGKGEHTEAGLLRIRMEIRRKGEHCIISLKNVNSGGRLHEKRSGLKGKMSRKEGCSSNAKGRQDQDWKPSKRA